MNEPNSFTGISEIHALPPSFRLELLDQATELADKCPDQAAADQLRVSATQWMILHLQRSFLVEGATL